MQQSFRTLDDVIGLSDKEEMTALTLKIITELNDIVVRQVMKDTDTVALAIGKGDALNLAFMNVLAAYWYAVLDGVDPKVKPGLYKDLIQRIMLQFINALKGAK